MGPDLEKSKATNEVLTRKDNVFVTHDEKDDLVQCMSNCKNNKLYEEVINVNDGLAKVPAETEDVEVNIVGCSKFVENVQVEETRCEDCTESMSSFGDTLSDNQTDPLQDDMEAESRFSFDGAPTPAWAFDAYGDEFPRRRKKLTDHWRRFIRPLMWRCKWIELQIKEFQAQTQKYDRQLGEYADQKLFDFVEGLETKSLPFSSCTKRKKVIKRKKRKRVEETTDTTSYMIRHNLFSYYENKKSATGGGGGGGGVDWINDNCGNLDKAISAIDEFGLQDEWPSFDCKGDDNIYENSLQKIEQLQSQVRKLKARIEKVESENPGKFASVYRLTMPETYDVLTDSDQDLASPPESRDQTAVRSKTVLHLHKSDFNVGDVLPQSAVSTHREVVPVSNMIESTSQPQVGVSGENTKEGILVDETVVKEEMQDSKNYGSQLMEKIQELSEKQTSADEMPTGTLAARVNFGGKTLPKHRSNASNNKRNRGRRKSAKSYRKK